MQTFNLYLNVFSHKKYWCSPCKNVWISPILVCSSALIRTWFQNLSKNKCKIKESHGVASQMSKYSLYRITEMSKLFSFSLKYTRRLWKLKFLSKFRKSSLNFTIKIKVQKSLWSFSKTSIMNNFHFSVLALISSYLIRWDRWTSQFIFTNNQLNMYHERSQTKRSMLDILKLRCFTMGK